jgi:hypothetical protein
MDALPNNEKLLTPGIGHLVNTGGELVGITVY